MSYCELLFEESLNLTLYKDIQYIKNFRPDWLKNPLTGKNLEYDFYIPKFKMAFEIQGDHHWTSDYQKYKDNIKREISKNKGIDLVELSISQVTCSKLRKIFTGAGYNKKRKIQINLNKTLINLNEYTTECKAHDQKITKYKTHILRVYKSTKATLPPALINKKKIYSPGAKLIRMGDIKYVVIEESKRSIKVRPFTSTYTKWININKIDEILF